MSVPSQVIAALGGVEPTPQQWEAISAPLEPCALIAGAGSGKTAVMTARMVWLIINGHAQPNEILGLTFTNKAAESLLTRVRAAIAPLGLPEGQEPVIGTYHSFASSLIGDYGLRGGIEPGAGLLTEAQAWQLCADCYLSRTYQAMEPRTLWHVGWVRKLADDCANHLVDPREVAEHDRGFLERISDSSDRIAGKVITCSRKRIEMAEVAAAYAAAKDARNVIDYGDQIRLAHRIAQDPSVVADFHQRFRFVLLDEYQDTNEAQAQMLRALIPPGFPVMAVGDPDQNIYAWRGASLRNLLRFADDFPNADGSRAAERRLEVNFRSGSRILNLANMLIQGVDESRRPPDKVLRHFEPLGEGSIAVALVGDQVAEAEAIADEARRLNAEGIPWREMTVLCRKKRLFDAIVETFRARDVPAEVVGLGGLLAMPEVVDLVALLRVLDDPMRNVALARLLQGPRWRIGYRDLALIGRHAMERNRVLREDLATYDEFPTDVAYSLAEAVGMVDEVEGVSAEARARLARFNDWLGALRAQTHLPLTDLVAAAVDALGIMRELDASPSEAAPAAKRNVANFMDRVAAFEPLDGEPTLGALVEWLDAVEEADEEIEAAQPTDVDAIKVMTIHQAKGLEFDVVFLPGLAKGESSRIFPDVSRQANPATGPQHIPFELRGDREVLPRFEGVLNRFVDELKARGHEEERRLLYVAVTRARKRLVASAAHWYMPSGSMEALKNPFGPSEYFDEIAAFPDVEVLSMVEQPEVNPLIERRAARAVNWPREGRRSDLAERVAAARASAEPDETLFPLETNGATPRVPTTLAATSLVTYSTCPKRFFWSVVRPLPRRPSRAARIGTEVHAWIERTTKRQLALIDPEEHLEVEPGSGPSRVAELRAAFEASRFAGRDPWDTERAFALVIGDVVIQGRIDAIYAEGDAWEIVDWKTGRAPEGATSMDVQLDLYCLAAQEIWGKRPEELALMFVYLGGDEPVERRVEARPAAAIRAELETTLSAIAAEAFEPQPSGACHSCDFVRDCAPGQEHVAATS